MENPDLKVDGEISYSFGSQEIWAHCWCFRKQDNVFRSLCQFIFPGEGHNRKNVSKIYLNLYMLQAPEVGGLTLAFGS